MRKERLDGIGLVALIAVTLLLAFNQIIINVVIHGLQPVFFAGARSARASVVVAGGFIAWLWLMSVYPAPTVVSFSFLSPILPFCSVISCWASR